VSGSGTGALLGVQAASELMNRELGTRIRRIRTERGLTLGDVAQSTGLSASMLSMLERGKTGVSVGSLVAVASALGVAIGDLFQPTRSPELSLVRFDQQQELSIGPGISRRVIQRSRTHGLEVAMLTLAPGTHTGTELVRHEGQEIVVVQEGTLTVEIADSSNELEVGDSLRLNAEVPHRFVNRGSRRSRVLLVAQAMSQPRTSQPRTGH